MAPRTLSTGSQRLGRHSRAQIKWGREVPDGTLDRAGLGTKPRRVKGAREAAALRFAPLFPYFSFARSRASGVSMSRKMASVARSTSATSLALEAMMWRAPVSPSMARSSGT